jgi:ABC-type branched-subunit amino acid transport system ATPase component
MDTLLDVRHIGISFNGLKVLGDVSFSLSKGTITGLFGENGSGKTTLFHIVSGYLKANSGEIMYKGHDLNGKKPVEIARLGIGRSWQTPRIFKNLSVLDNLLIATKNHPGEHVLNYLTKPGFICHEEKNRILRSEALSVEVGLGGKLQKTALSLSFGQQKLLSIGMLLMNDADLLLLDEPFSGVNGQMIDQLSTVLTVLKEKGKTICMIEHNRVKTKEISTQTFILSNGKIEVEVI